MTLNVKMSVSRQLISSAMTYVRIVPSSIQVNLIQFGPSIIIRGQQQSLILDPGTFSIDPDETYFNFSSQNWNYTYFCGVYNNQTIDSLIPSCFKNSTGKINNKSSLFIFYIKEIKPSGNMVQILLDRH